LLWYIVEHAKDCPDACADSTGYWQYIKNHADWAEIEKNCRYMITHRDIDRMDVSQSKKRKIDEWYIFVNSRLKFALVAQEKYEEAIPVIEEYIQFTLSQKGTGFSWVVNEYGEIYRYYLLMNASEKAEAFKEKCKMEWTVQKIDVSNWDWDEAFEKWGEN
jgi:hypothetical protein